jgi:hypothetical protein
MGRIANSWALAKSSWAVLKADKELAAIPVLSFVATAVVLAIFGGLAYGTIDQVTEAGETSYSATPLTYLAGVVGYLGVTFVVTYFVAVLVAGAYQRLTGDDPSLTTAFGAANARLGPIFLWSMLTGTVGLILQMLRERLGFLGQIVVNLVGMAWEIVTWLAIPIVVVEGTGPIESLRKSAGLFKKTWGENLIAQGGFGLLGIVVVLPIALVAGAIATAIPLVGIALGVVGIALVSIVLSALNGIYRTALYLFASTGTTPDYFSDEEMRAAFAAKKSRF